MTLRIYNTLSRAKEPFVPLTPGKVKMYVCGPTVYDYIHIGNARPLIFFDAVRKYMLQCGYEVDYVVNFTDVDDKLIRKAEEQGKSVLDVADYYIRAYFEDADALGIMPATVHPRVTDTIPEILSFIEQLVESGYAYEQAGDVYFRTAKFPEYGKLSHQNLIELQAGARIEVDERKEDPHDFVLWKRAKPGEIYWESLWGQGRPGWHIECSAMARKHLGVTLDIHGGGHDLQFPHHECELAQSESLNGAPLANYWMHNGYIHIDNEKMSKSLGNGIRVKHLLQRIKPQLLRFFMLSTHYRNPLNYSDESIEQAGHALARIENSVSNLRHRIEELAQAKSSAEDTAELQGNSAELRERLAEIRAEFDEKMQDDFNTPDALTAMYELVSETNIYLQRPTVVLSELNELYKRFIEMDDVLGILAKPEEGMLDEQIDRLIVERNEARSAKNWARADEIRELLQQQGILLEDTPYGIRWRRK